MHALESYHSTCIHALIPGHMHPFSYARIIRYMHPFNYLLSCMHPFSYALKPDNIIVCSHACTLLAMLSYIRACAPFSYMLSYQSTCTLLAMLSYQSMCTLLAMLSYQSMCTLSAMLSYQSMCTLLAMLPCMHPFSHARGYARAPFWLRKNCSMFVCVCLQLWVSFSMEDFSIMAVHYILVI